MQSTNTVAATQQDVGESFIRFPYEISFVDCEPSDAVRFQIEEGLGKVSALWERITDCKVALRINHRHSRNRFFHIHIQMDVPGRRLVVNRDIEARGKNTDIHSAVREAFHKLTRQLDDFLDIRKSFAAKPQFTLPPVEEPEYDWD